MLSRSHVAPCRRWENSLESPAVKAVQLVAHGKPGQFRFHDVPEPDPGPGEVVVRVRACGLNHLDLWLEEGDLPIPISLPRIPGGEIAGEVLKAASDVGKWKTEDRVAIQSNLFCGACEFCLRIKIPDDFLHDIAI